jgi:cobalt-zinc-cadmium efflux system membrane fusion protein
MKTHRKYIIIIVLLIVGITSCNSTKKTELDEIALNDNSIVITSAQFENSKMKLGKAAMQTFNEVIKTNGYIDVPPNDRAKVSAIIGGYVKKSHLLVGDIVKKGELLLTIENPYFIEIQQKYLEIYEQLTYLKSEKERQKILFDEKISSQKNYLKAESDYKSSLASFSGLGKKLKMMNVNLSNVKEGDFTSIIAIYAPITGIVSEIYTNVGEFKNASDVLLEIINNSHKHLELTVFEKDILNVKEKQSILFKIPEASSDNYKATVHLVGKTVGENRTVKIHGHINNDENNFMVGMFVEAEIITNSFQKYALPITAILEEEDNNYILVLKESDSDTYKFEKVKLSVERRSEKWVELSETDSAILNKRILLKGAFLPLN